MDHIANGGGGNAFQALLLTVSVQEWLYFVFALANPHGHTGIPVGLDSRHVLICDQPRRLFSQLPNERDALRRHLRTAHVMRASGVRDELFSSAV